VAVQRDDQPFVEQRPVGQAGERIVVRLVMQPPLPLGHPSQQHGVVDDREHLPGHDQPQPEPPQVRLVRRQLPTGPGAYRDDHAGDDDRHVRQQQVQPVGLGTHRSRLVGAARRSQRRHRDHQRAEQVPGRLQRRHPAVLEAQQAQRVGYAERDEAQSQQPQRDAPGARRRPGRQQQPHHGHDGQIRDRVGGRDAHDQRTLLDPPEHQVGHHRPGQREQRPGDQHTVDDQDHRVPPGGGGRGPGQRGGGGEQRQQHPERQDEEADVGDRRTRLPCGFHHVPNDPPQADQRPAGEPDRQRAPPPAAGTGGVTARRHADGDGHQPGDELGRVIVPALGDAGRHQRLADGYNGGNEGERDRQPHRQEPCRRHHHPQPRRGSASRDSE
jgi:hypothetical protein